MAVDFSNDPKFGLFGVSYDGKGHIELHLPDSFIGAQNIGMGIQSARLLADALNKMCDEGDQNDENENEPKQPGKVWPANGIMASIVIKVVDGHVMLVIPPEMVGGVGIYAQDARELAISLLRGAFHCDGQFPMQGIIEFYKSVMNSKTGTPIPPTTNQRN